MTGKICRAYTVWCKRCSEMGFTSFSWKRDAENAFRRRGWKKTKDEGWICPKCAKERPNRERS
jgi:hypothetical protein